MKQIITAILLLCFGIVMLAQQNLQMREINPDFLEYMDRKNNGETEFRTSEGYYLGETPSPLILNFDNLQVSTTRSLPVSYDLRTISGGAYITSVKDQGEEGACWAFATYAAVESYRKKQSGITYDLSEQNLATCHRFDWLPSQGGNQNISTAYLSRRSGPISEANDPYTLPSNPNCVEGLTPVAYVGEARYLPGKGSGSYSADIIKQTIIDNGALYVNMCFDNNYMNYTDKTYYYNGTESTNHGVAVVGWDNTKVVTGGSAATPSSQGAWIIKNSWGPGWGENGYFYISYEDTKALTSVAYFPSNINYNADSEIYYYDDFGAISGFGYGSGNNYGLVKYIASENQQITMIGTYINDAETDVTIEIYDNFNGGTLSNLLGTTGTNSCTYPGYYTFNLLDPTNIIAENDFYIKVLYNSGTDYPIPLEMVYDGYASDVSIETGVCWVSGNGSSWLAIGATTDYEYDLCIKAYAVNVAIDVPVADFTADNTSLTVGETVSFSDLSTGSPDDWTWTFEGGTPASSYSQNPTVSWTTPGTYSVTLSASNFIGSDNITKTDYITVANAPVVCEYHSNFADTDSLTYYTTGNGYLSGHNDYNFTEFAEYYDSHSNNLVTGVKLAVAHANNISGTGYITMKIWDENGGLPDNELYAEDFDLANFSEYYYNDITFANSTNVPDAFFIGYQIYFTTPQDTFNVYQAKNRDASSSLPSTAYIKYDSWGNVSDIFTDFNSSFAIYPEICPSLPTADFIVDVSNGCNNLTVQFTDQSSANTDFWLWDFGDGSSTSSDTNPVHTYTVPGTYTVTLTATNTIGSNVASQTDLIVIGITPNPVMVSGGGTQCGGTKTIVANGGNGGIIYFQGTTSGGVSTLNPSTLEIISTSGAYYFRSKSPDGCWSNQGSATVTINTVPDPVIVSGGDTQCGGTITLNASGGDGGTIYFQGTNSGGGSSLTVSSLENISTSGTYYFRSQSPEGCWGEEGSDAVTIYPLPIVDLGEDQQNCGDYITFDAGPGFTSYVWNDEPYQQTLTVGVSGDYTVVVTDANDCTATDVIHVDIFEAPYFTTTVNGETSVGAEDGSISLDLTYVNSPQIIWSTGASTETISGLGTGNYSVTVEAGNGCSSTETIFVPLEVPPAAEFTANQTLLCGSYTVEFTDESQYLPTSWTWSFGDGETSNEQNPVYEYASHGIYNVTLTVENAFGDNVIIKENYIAIGETPEINYIVTPATGELATDGVISVSVSGGTEPYSILWNHDATETSLQLTNLISGLYYITVTENFNCSASETIEVNWVSTVGNLTHSFSIYPNPTETQVTIISDGKPILNLIIINVLGEIVYQHNSDIGTEQLTISTKDFASGTYFIKLDLGDDYVIQKLIKQ